jgi:hypothetical protein
MKAYSGSRSIAPLILYLDTRWGCVVNIMPLLIYPRKEPWYPLNRKVVGSHIPFGYFG